MKILVTGGGGFLGSSVCRQLAAAGHEVIAFQRSPADHLASDGVRSFEGDITDFSQLAEAAAACDAVIHTAGKAGMFAEIRSMFHFTIVTG